MKPTGIISLLFIKFAAHKSNDDLVQAESAKHIANIVPCWVEKTTLSDWTSIKRVIEQRTLQAIEFSRKMNLDYVLHRISTEVYEQFQDELSRAKKEAKEANEENLAQIKNDECYEIENQIKCRILVLFREWKFKTYANQWRFSQLDQVQ